MHFRRRPRESSMRRPVEPSCLGRSRNAPRPRLCGRLDTSSARSITREGVRETTTSKCGTCIARGCRFVSFACAERLGASTLRRSQAALSLQRCNTANAVKVPLGFWRCRSGQTLRMFPRDLPSEWPTKISIAPSASRNRRDSFRRRRFSHPRTSKHVRPTPLTH